MRNMAHIAAAIACAGVLFGVATACQSEPAKVVRAPAPPRDVPEPLRNTVGTQVTINGIEPVLVSGLGLVVGLNGTGGLELPERIAATMEQVMGRFGISRANQFGGPGVAERSPRQMLSDPNVAVVVVQAAIPPGAPKGYSFDLFVRAINATSLEGGQLWTTDLQIGEATAFGGVQTKKIARGRGPIFINPFADPGANKDGVSRTVGRVLAGGSLQDPFRLELFLDNPSHGRARAIASAINGRFPEGPGDAGPTARGRNEESIAVTVPQQFRQRPQEFVELLKGVQIDQSAPEEYAKRYVDAIQNEPALAVELAWALEALGPKAVPFARGLYDHPEVVPQMAGLRVGARLSDPLAAEQLIELAERGQPGVRTYAISLLAQLDAGPRVDAALRQLLNTPELTVRVAAYEALATRAERAQLARLVRAQQNAAPGEQTSYTQLEILSMLSLPGRTDRKSVV